MMKRALVIKNTLIHSGSGSCSTIDFFDTEKMVANREKFLLKFRSYHDVVMEMDAISEIPKSCDARVDWVFSRKKNRLRCSTLVKQK